MDVQGWVVIGLAFILFGYLVPHLVQSRHQLAQARVEDRFSTTLRVVGTGATAKRPSPGEHHGTRANRPYLHDPRRRTETPAVNRPTTQSERAAAEARRLAAARAARAAEISRRKAAARRRLVLTVVLLVASIGGWLGVGLASASIAVAVVPTVLLGAVLVLGRRAAKIAARRNAADRAAMARLELRPTPRTRLAGQPHGATAVTAAPASAQAAVLEATPAEPGATTDTEEHPAETVSEAAGEDAPSAAEQTVAETATAEDAEATAETGRGWTPIPVPAPSYTLKAAVPRRDVAPYEAPEPEAVAAEEYAEPVVTSGLAGSPYAPVADPQPDDAPTPVAAPGRGLDVDSVLARRRAVGA